MAAPRRAAAIAISTSFIAPDSVTRLGSGRKSKVPSKAGAAKHEPSPPGTFDFRPDPSLVCAAHSMVGPLRRSGRGPLGERALPVPRVTAVPKSTTLTALHEHEWHRAASTDVCRIGARVRMGSRDHGYAPPFFALIRR